MASFFDEDEMPLAKRQRLLLQQRGVPSKRLKPHINTKANSPDPSDVIIILNDSDDASSPATATAHPLRPQVKHASPAAAPRRNPPPNQHEISLLSSSEDDDDDDDEIVDLTDVGNSSRYRPPPPPPSLFTSSSSLASRPPPSAHTHPPIRRPSTTPPTTTTIKTVKTKVMSGGGIKLPPRPWPTNTVIIPPPPPPPSSSRAPTQLPPIKKNTSITFSSSFSSRHRSSTAHALDEPYQFTTQETSAEFRQNFTKPPRASLAMSKAAMQKRTKEILFEMTQPARTAAAKSQVAWKEAALRWREKHKPSQADLKRRQEEDHARACQGARWRAQNTPAARMNAAAAAAGGDGGGAGGSRAQNDTGGDGGFNDMNGGGGVHGGGGGDAAPPRPDPEASESEWRVYYRNIAQRKVEPADSFIQVLRIFGVPCEDPLKVRDAYRVAVRMYHPDSNSKEKAWKNPIQKLQAEEVLKIINERKHEMTQV